MFIEAEGGWCNLWKRVFLMAKDDSWNLKYVTTLNW